MQIKDTEIRFIKGDIARAPAQAFVCPANNRLTMENGLAASVKRKAGREVEEEAGRKGPVKVGEAVWTSAGKLKAQYIIFAAMIEEGKKTDEAILRLVCGNALRCAEELHLETLAFPALGCEIGGFPVIGAAKIMAQEMIKYFRREASGIREIIFCLQDVQLYRAFEQTISGYISHVQDRLGEGPYATVDIIIETANGIVLVERSNPPYGWALPGGFVDCGESLETAAAREAKEETNLDLVALEQFHAYSAPDRDPRFHTISTVFIAQGKGKPRFGDDAKNLKIVPYEELLKADYAFDHKKIIEDYLKYRHKVRVSR